MEINRKPLSYGSLSFRNQKPAKPTSLREYRIQAIDTETYIGTARLICDGTGRYLLEPDAERTMSFLCSTPFRRAYVFCYNLRFDAQAILKLLPEKYLREVAGVGKTEYRGYKIKYIPSKLLTVTDSQKHTCRLFDIAQFFETSLDNAANTFLGDRKIEFPFKAQMNVDLGIWEQYEEDIIRYCQKDAELTQRLGEFLNTKFKTAFGCTPHSYISKGNLGKYLIRRNCDIPDTRKIPGGVMETAFYSYKGGRFEVIEKGAVGNCEMYDIVSAYPYEIANLIDMTKGKWKPVSRLHEEAVYGFYICHVVVKYDKICPLAYVAPQNYLYYPFGAWDCYLTKQEVEAYSKYVDIEIISGWEFFPQEIVKPFETHIHTLFERKKITPKNAYEYDLVKKMMNSIYGAFYEKTKREDKIITGVLFNPVYASMITANTRIKLFQMAKQHEKDIVAMATDSVLLKGKHVVDTGKELGDWGLDVEGEAVVVTNGVYEIAGKTKTRGIMAKTEAGGNRGMQTKYGKFENLFAYMRGRPELSEYTFFTDKPIQMKEACNSREKFNVSDINTWQRIEKSIRIDTDLKRIFTEKFGNGGNYFTKSVSSEPMVILEK